MADFAKLPKADHSALRHWLVEDIRGRQRPVGLAKLLSADNGWIKFARPDGSVVMYSTVNLFGAAQVSDEELATAMEKLKSGQS